MLNRPLILCLVVALSGAFAPLVAADEPQRDKPSPPVLLAHYMPWYVAKPYGGTWGWHWTMNHFDPDQIDNDTRPIASHYYPLIGPYDSGDPHVLEYHLLQMKLAGIEGVIVDWYGLQDFRDYAVLHRNTQRLVRQASKLGMKFAICYEDQTIPALVEAGRLAEDQRVSHAKGEIEWLVDNWLGLPGYVRLDGQPILLSFGQSGLSNEEWTECLAKLDGELMYFSQHLRRTAAVGAFDWPIPQEGLAANQRFQNKLDEWPQAITVAFPRFVDIYEQAQVHASWGRIEDEQGETLKRSFEIALKSKTRLIQLATWNDWGEGTMIEPSREWGYRDLEFIQNLCRDHIDETFAATPADLRLPHTLLEARRRAHDSEQAKLDMIAQLIADGELREARVELRGLSVNR